MRPERPPPVLSASDLEAIVCFVERLRGPVTPSSTNTSSVFTAERLPPGVRTKRFFFEVCRQNQEALNASKIGREWVVDEERWRAWLATKSTPVRPLRLVEAAPPSGEEALAAALGLVPGSVRRSA